MKKLIAKNVPKHTFETYNSCKDCHMYGVVDSNIFMTDKGLETFRSYGCTGIMLTIEDGKENEVSRNCPYLAIDETFRLDSIDIFDDYEDEDIHL